MNDLKFWFDAVQRRWVIVVLCIVVATAAAFVFGKISSPVYSAEARLLFEDSTVLAGQEPDNGRRADAAAATRGEVIHSRLVAQEVAGGLSATSKAAAEDLWRSDASNTVSFDRWLLEWLLENTSVDAPVQGNIATIRAEAPTPEFAAEIANAFARSFIEKNRELQTQPTHSYTEWLDQSTQEARVELGQAEQALASFMRRNGLVSGADLSPEINRLQALSTELATAEADAVGASVLSGANGAASAEVQQTELIQSLRGQIAEQAAEVGRLSARYGSDHTVLRAAQSKLSDLRASLARETEVAARSVDVSNAAATAKRQVLQRLVDQQRGRMLRMTGSMDQLAVLQAEADRVRRDYEQLTLRLTQVRLQSDGLKADARLLDPALPPVDRSSPKIALLLVLGALLGLIGGVAAAIILEHFRPRDRMRDGDGQAESSEEMDASLPEFSAPRPVPAAVL